MLTTQKRSELAQGLLARLLPIERARRNPLSAVDIMRYAGLTPDPWQTELLESSWQRALLLCSRQSGKSTVTASLALHTAHNQPGSLTLLLSPSQRQSQELFRTVMSFYHSLPLPMPVAQVSTMRLQLVNGSRVIALPGREGTIRGFSAVDLLIIDEASRVDDGLYYSVRPMLAVSGGKLICLSTPFGKRGFFHQEFEEGSEEWHRTKVLATDVPRISPSFLEEERAALGDWWFRQEYMCEFVETTDQVFGFDVVMGAMSADVLPLFGGVI